MGIRNRLMHAFNAFNKPTEDEMSFAGNFNYGAAYAVRPDQRRTFVGGDKTILTSIINRISIDAASIALRHVKIDENGRYLEDMVSGLNRCLTLEANIDQGARHFRQDIVLTLLEKGTVAIVPVDTDEDPRFTNSYDIKTMRVGEIVNWYPRHVKVRLWNDDPKAGRHEEIVMAKDKVAIVQNPLYAVMNETNSTLQRLIRKLTLLDAIDEQSGSGKLDIIIQLPYAVRNETKQKQAEIRRADLELQLQGSKYGVAYADATEKITQLNRPAENNMLKQVEYLQEMLYGQLGLTPSVFDGSADEATMLNYHNRTIEPILAAISEAMKRSFLTKTAQTQGQSIEYFRDPFKLAAVASIAEMADKFARNEIMNANEIRAIVGLKPSKDPKAEQLINSNMPQPSAAVQGQPSQVATAEQDNIVDETFRGLEESIDQLLGGDE